MGQALPGELSCTQAGFVYVNGMGYELKFMACVNIKDIPSRHTTSKCRYIDVDATSTRHIDVSTTLFKRCVSAVKFS